MPKTTLTNADVPKYIRKIVQRLRPDTTITDKGVWGYNFKLYGQHKCGYEGQLLTECAKLLAWCRQHYAEAEIVEQKLWYDQMPHTPGDSIRCIRQRAYKRNIRSYMVVTITDPVAQRFEKDGFYKEEKFG